ncbi:MAG: hypothetical protein ACERLG_13110, partial [Sedimentibacter sp.]
MNINRRILIKRVGIDRSVLYDFPLISLDANKLTSFKNVQFELNENSPILLESGERLGKLVIIDKFLGRMKVEFNYSNLHNKHFINTTLELMVSGSDNNLQNLNTEEYKDRIKAVFDYLENTYTIKADYSKIKVKKLELNATFFLDEPYENYKQAILMMIRNVSPKRFGCSSSNNAIKYATWHEANMKTNKDTLETALVKNSSIEIKVYNKGKQLQDIGEIENSGQSIMRVEYSIKDRRILQNAFGDDLVESLSDVKINNLFQKYFNRDIVAPYYAWRSKNKKELVGMVKRHREVNPSRWSEYFIREARQYEQMNGLPILFDIYDLQGVFRELEPPTG